MEIIFENYVNLTRDFDVNPEIMNDDVYVQKYINNQSLSFIKENLMDFVNIYGSTVTTSLLEDLKNEYNELECISESITDAQSDPYTTSEKIKNTFDKITKDKDNQIIGWSILAAIALAGAYKIYKNYFSKAAKYCKDKTGEEKKACMVNYQNNAYQMKINALKKSLSLSKKANNPKKYTEKIQKEINKLKKKIKK